MNNKSIISGLLIGLGLVLGCLSSAYGDELSVIALPHWVEPVDFERNEAKENSVDVREGVYHALVDYQVIVGDDQPTQYYTHFVKKIVNEVGVEDSSQFEIYFDPNFQVPYLHAINVWREGKKINKIKTANFTLLHDESERSNPR